MNSIPTGVKGFKQDPHGIHTGSVTGSTRDPHGIHTGSGRAHLADRPRVAEYRSTQHSRQRAELREDDGARPCFPRDHKLEWGEVETLSHGGDEQHVRHSPEGETCHMWDGELCWPAVYGVGAPCWPAIYRLEAMLANVDPT